MPDKRGAVNTETSLRPTCGRDRLFFVECSCGYREILDTPTQQHSYTAVHRQRCDGTVAEAERVFTDGE